MIASKDSTNVDYISIISRSTGFLYAVSFQKVDDQVFSCLPVLLTLGTFSSFAYILISVHML